MNRVEYPTLFTTTNDLTSTGMSFDGAIHHIRRKLIHPDKPPSRESQLQDEEAELVHSDESKPNQHS